MAWIGWFLVLAGLAALAAAIFDLDFFMKSTKAKIFAMLMGKKKVRLLYGVVGTILVVFGTLIGLGKLL